ncbi:MAG: 5-(carboxyamino)imidazole ribonucleotide mutase [Planctomycetes bacterium]|nr:5-(carboxyamino)imidazole ribonucleotide mutase [Planctomycetota bacterium]
MPDVALLMGSDSDLEHVQDGIDALKKLGVSWEARVLSAHRTLDALQDYVRKSDAKIFIAAAGGAAHLAGVVAALTTRPVLAIPIPSALNGLDSLLSMVQMPGGVPVATFAVGKAGARNAALFAAQILALSDAKLSKKLADQKRAMADEVAAKDEALQKKLRG